MSTAREDIKAQREATERILNATRAEIKKLRERGRGEKEALDALIKQERLMDAMSDEQLAALQVTVEGIQATAGARAK